MRNYIIKQLTQITAWIGALIIALEILRVPDWLVACVGLWLILVDDEIVHKLCAKLAPGIAAKLRQGQSSGTGK